MSAEAVTPRTAANEEIAQQYRHMFFSWPKVLGLAGAAPFNSFSKVGTTLSLRSEGAVISTTATGESRARTAALLRSQLTGVTPRHISSLKKLGENNNEWKAILSRRSYKPCKRRRETKDIQLRDS